MKITIKLIEAENEFIATCPELDINCYASSRNDAIRRIVNVLKFYIESAKELGLEVENLDAISIEGISSGKWILKESFYHKSNAIN